MLLETLGRGPSKRVLDLGCGTGEHARFLAEQGFEVVGVDASESMIASARDEPMPENLLFVQGDLAALAAITEGPFGGAICLGNTLPHIRREGELLSLWSALRQLLLPAAPLLIQLLNYERIFSRQERHLPLNFRSDGEEEIIFLRLMELQDDGEVSFYPSTLRLVPGGDPPLEVKAAKEVRLHGWRVEELRSGLERAGFDSFRLLGDFAGREFDPQESRDLILLAQ